MECTLANQAKRAGLALAAAAAFSAIGTGTAQAQEFTRAEIGLDRSGNLTCSFRETGLGAQALITYTCGAEALGVVSGCFVRNKFVGPTSLSIFKNVSNAEEGHPPAPLVAKNNGTINATLTVEIPESHGAEVCTEPAVQKNIAVRWCNASLVDTTNNIVGASTGELLAQLESTGTAVVPVPTCAELLAAPPTNGGGA
jgi:hypothetical protein